MRNSLCLLFLLVAPAAGSACHDLYYGGGCEECMLAGSYCNYCPKDNKCSNSDLGKYCSCAAAECVGQDCSVKQCPAKPTPPPTPQPKAAKFTLTVEEITNALNRPKAGHPLENLLISKILGVFAKDNITLVGGDITYDAVGPQVIVKNDTCKMYVQIDQGWTTQAVLLPDTSVTLELGIGRTGHILPDFIIGGGIHLDSTFHIGCNIHMHQGSSIIHRKGKPCSIITTEDSRETIEGDLNIAVNATLELQPALKRDDINGLHLHFTPTVKVAGQLMSFDAKVYSALTVFGIDMHKISFLVDTVIDVALKKEITNRLVQVELVKLQAKLQKLADQIFPPETSQGALPGITPELVTQLQAAMKNIRVAQAGHYP